MIKRKIFQDVIVHMRVSFLLLIVLMSSVSGALAKNISYNNLAPHKALYAIELIETKSGSQIVNVHGQMFYEWQSTCDAWTSDHRFNLFYEYTDASPINITSDFSTYEPFDGRSMSFTSRRRRNGTMYEELRGKAFLNDTGDGAAQYTKPKGLEYDLPQGALFPMGHTLSVMQAMAKENTFHHAVIFDGSDADGPVSVNAFIGGDADRARIDDLQKKKEIEASLIKLPAKNVRLAFFPMKKDQAEAEYEMDIVLHENGVISDMRVEYDDFSITQKLVALEALNRTCESIKKNGK